MNDLDTYTYLAQTHAKYGRPLRIDELNPSIPYFEIYKNNMGRLDVRGFNYEHHDNAPRMALWEFFLKNNILPNISRSPEFDIKGFYNLELHDSYTYLDNGKNYDGVLTFSKFKTDDGPVLIPDPYAMQNWGGMVNGINDNAAWSSKINKVCFYGTTTGKRDPTKNDRINMCLWSLAKPDLYDFKITKIAQMSPESVYTYLGSRFDNVISKPISPMEQMKYKYHLVMDGNTCRFDIWHYITNTVTFKHQSPEMLWYYPILLDGCHFIEVNKDNMEAKMQMTPQNAEFIINNAKFLMNKILKPVTHMFYLSSVFEHMAHNGK